VSAAIVPVCEPYCNDGAAQPVFEMKRLLALLVVEALR